MTRRCASSAARRDRFDGARPGSSVTEPDALLTARQLFPLSEPGRRLLDGGEGRGVELIAAPKVGELGCGAVGHVRRMDGGQILDECPLQARAQVAIREASRICGAAKHLRRL